MWNPFCRRRSGAALIATAITEGFKLMSTTLAEGLASLNTATNAVADEVALLRTQLANVATPEQLAALDGVVARLTSLAADPANPVPTIPPTAA